MNFAPECSFRWDGAALAILLSAIPLAIVLTVATLFLYRWGVGRAMRTAAQEAVPMAEALAASPPRCPLEITVVAQSAGMGATSAGQAARLRAMRRLTMAYLLAGLLHATLATAVMFWLNGLDFKLFRALSVWTVFAWPVIAVLMMTATATRRQQAWLVAAYFAFLSMLEIIAETFHLRNPPGFGELFLLWAIVMGPSTAVIALLANRAWRSVGLTALFVSIVVMAAVQLGFMLIGCTILSTRSSALLDARHYLQLALVLVCVVLVWMLLRRAARRYQAKQASDQMLTLDSWWLLVTALEIVFQIGSSGFGSFSFLLAFAGYKFALHQGLRRLDPSGQSAPPQPMLLLRVFGHAERARSLVDQVGQTWRHAGPINMIGGTDLATALLEPDELMAFWSGALRQGFVGGPNDLDNRLHDLDEGRDPDGRYRINAFYCYDNTWRATVGALAGRSAVVLMDLRGFGKDNRGCEFELAMLLGEVPLARVVLLVDRSTRTEDLKALLNSLWEQLPGASPNRDLAHPIVQLFHVDDSSKALRPLLSRLFAAAA